MSKLCFFFFSVLLAVLCQNVNSQYYYSSSSRVCEGNNMTLACASGYLLSVCSANYGRLLPGCLACPKWGSDWFTLCFSSNATVTMRSRCNDRDNCTVAASNTVFGNPCAGTYKYLTAEYTCLPYKRVCEGSTMTITCPSGQSIQIISANYGRTLPGTEVCQYSDPKATTNTNCSAANSTQIVASQCNNQNSCSVQATSSTFGGDPCPGTYKYLQATYNCVY